MKKVLISGGSRGIGNATAKILSGSDYQVYAPNSVEMNVCDSESIDSYFTKHFSSGEIYALICNAGIFAEAKSHEQDIREWEAIINVNLTGAFRLCQKVLPQMVSASKGRIIMMSSVSGTMGEPEAAAYCASKAGMLGLMKSLALEYGSSGINVNAICPGWVRTDMAEDILDTENKVRNALGAVLQNRWIEADEVAELVKYLLSDSARAITGQAITIGAGIDL